MGAMMRYAWQSVWRQIFSGVVTAGFEDVNRAHVGLFRFPGLDGQRPSELADQLQISKQSVNDLLGHLEARGYLAREPDPADGRGRIVRLTPKGWQLQETTHRLARAAEQHIADTLGPSRYKQLQHALEDLTRLGAPGDLSAPRR